MEPDHKAMIVVNHPWEFVPKGSSHLNYHTNSSAIISGATTKQTDNKTIKIAGVNMDTGMQEQTLTSTQQQQQQQQQLDKKAAVASKKKRQSNDQLWIQ